MATIERLLGSASVYFQLARFFVVFFIGLFVTRAAVMPAARWLIGRRGGEKKAVYSAENLVGVLGVFISLTAALQAAAFGNLVTVVGTVAAALTIAIGFGMREQIGNLVSGLFIQLDTPFLRGDYIRSGDIEGRVKDIKLRETRLRSPTGEKLVVPNSSLSNNPLRNFTRDRSTFNKLDITVDPEDAAAVEELLHDIATGTDAVLETPEPEVHYEGMSDGKVVLELVYAVKESADVKAVRTAIVDAFSDRGVEAGIFQAEKDDGE
ncbi:MAG: mechanosensitive ion channel [Candidatus Nanohaloarchaea archaeon]|nr:mechanosensitive ion channel [Candidatus Nanohaloarchaea archaeon]